MRSYRGKFPHRISEVYGDPRGGGMIVRTNAGFRYRLVPATKLGSHNVPSCSVDISVYVKSPHYVVMPLDGNVANARG